jgi:tetratricopeptide (TPR) repeat protein
LSDFEPALRVLEESHELARQLNHARALELAVDCLAFVHHVQGDFVRAESYDRLTLELELHPRVRIPATFRLGMALTRLGRIAEGFAQVDAAMALARRAGRRTSLLQFPLRHAAILCELGCASRALETHTGLLPLIEQASQSKGNLDPHLRALHGSCLLQISIDLLQLGRYSDARDALRVARQLYDDDSASIRRGHPRRDDGSWLELTRLELELASGDVTEAMLQVAVRIVDEQHRLCIYDEEAYATHVLARLLQRRGDRQGALERLRRSLDLVQRYPMPLISWRLHALYSELLAAEGQAERAATATLQAKQTLQALAAHAPEDELRRSVLQLAANL